MRIGLEGRDVRNDDGREQQSEEEEEEATAESETKDRIRMEVVEVGFARRGWWSGLRIGWGGSGGQGSSRQMAVWDGHWAVYREVEIPIKECLVGK